MKLKLFFFLLIPFFSFANSWSVYPWTLKTENKIKVKSIPYKVHNGGRLGITKVYKKNKLIYSINEYLSGNTIIDYSGNYLINYDYSLYREVKNYYDINENGKRIDSKVENYQGRILTIYRKGIKIREIDFRELEIDTISLKKNDRFFFWNNQNKSLDNNSIFILENVLHILTIDNKIIKIDLETQNKKSIEKFDFSKVAFYKKLIPKTKFKVLKKDIPDSFNFPKLKDSRLLEESLNDFLKNNTFFIPKKTKNIWVTMLLNKKGICESIDISITDSKDINVKYNVPKVIAEIKNWFNLQRFKTKLNPRFTDKFIFEDIIEI